MVKCGKYGAKTRKKTVDLLKYFSHVQFTADSFKKTQLIHYNEQGVKLLTRKVIVQKKIHYMCITLFIIICFYNKYKNK